VDIEASHELFSLPAAGISLWSESIQRSSSRPSLQLGAAVGLAIFSGIATSRTNHPLARHVPLLAALTSGFRRALLASSIFLAAAAVIALRATNTRGEPMPALEIDVEDAAIDGQREPGLLASP